MTLCAVLVGFTEIPVMAMLSTSSGTATQGNQWHIHKYSILFYCVLLLLIDVDFDPIQVGILVFIPETQAQPQCISISIIDDSILEDTESFNVLLNSSVNARVDLGSPSIVYILDNDG